MNSNREKITNIVMVGVFAAVLAVLSQISFPLPSGIPVTLQTFAVALCGYALGCKRGTLAVLVYIVLGAVGLPVFANFSGGFGSLVGLAGGYIYGFPPIEEIMEGLNDAVKAGKVRAIGISNCYAWQLAQANYYARMHGMAEFVSVQGHYNLIFREEEREMAPFCKAENIAMTPYSALAAGRLSRHPDESSKRLEEDNYAKFKYDKTAETDGVIIDRVAELAEKRGCTMTEIALAWLLTKVASPICGATNLSHITGLVNAVELRLTADEIAYLEEPYVPHALVGVMAQNHG